MHGCSGGAVPVYLRVHYMSKLALMTPLTISPCFWITDHFSRTPLVRPALTKGDICEQVQFLLERDYVTFGSLLSQIHLSSVCNIGAPYSGVEPFSNISSSLCTLAILWPPCKILWRSFQRNPSIRGVKRKRGSKIEQWWAYRRLYLINGTK